MRFVQYLFGILLAVSISMTITLFTVNHFINADYFYETAQKSSLDQSVSEVITNRLTQISKVNGTNGNESAEKTLSSTVAKQYLEAKNHEITEQLEQVLRGKKDTIKIDFADLAAISKDAGLNVTGVDISPLELTPPKAIMTESGFFLQRIQFFLFLSTILSLILLASNGWLLYSQDNRVPLLATLLVVSFVLLGIATGIGSIDPASFGDIQLPETLATLQLPIINFIQYVVSDVQRWYQIAGGGILISASFLGFIEYFYSRKKSVSHYRR